MDSHCVCGSAERHDAALCEGRMPFCGVRLLLGPVGAELKNFILLKDLVYILGFYLELFKC